MNLQKTGVFIQNARKRMNLSQRMLGEKLSVERDGFLAHECDDKIPFIIASRHTPAGNREHRIESGPVGDITVLIPVIAFPVSVQIDIQVFNEAFHLIERPLAVYDHFLEIRCPYPEVIQHDGIIEHDPVSEQG